MEHTQVMQVNQEVQVEEVEVMVPDQQDQVTLLQYHHHKVTVVEQVLPTILN